MPAAPAYGTSKAGLIYLTQQVALDYSRLGFAATSCVRERPGPKMLEEAVSRARERSGDGHRRHLAEVRVGRADGQSVLARRDRRGLRVPGGEDSSFMTGAVLVVDGRRERGGCVRRRDKLTSALAQRDSPKREYTRLL